MQLSLREVAQLMDVPERTVYRWLKQKQLPGQLINSGYYFNRAELLEWAALHGKKLSPELFEARNGSGPVRTDLSLVGALKRGGIFRDVPGSDKSSVLREAVQRLVLPDDVDRDLLLTMLVAREDQSSTAVGGGIAIPHPRTPVIFPGMQSQVSLCLLRSPVPFGAEDGVPVSVVFTLLAPTMRVHLQLLARLAAIIQAPAFRELLYRSASDQELLQAVESTLQELPH